MRYLASLSLLCLVLCSSGCAWLFGDQGYFRERTMDYQKATNEKVLVIPEGVDSVAREPLYPIPDSGTEGAFSPKEFEDVPRPQSLLSVNQDIGVELRADDQRRWLVVERPRESVWVDLLEFAQAAGLESAPIEEGGFRLETNWMEPRKIQVSGFWASVWAWFTDGSVDMKEKFRFRLLPSAEGASSLVFVDHLRLEAEEGELPTASEVDWESSGKDSKFIAAILSELTEFLADEEVRFKKTTLFTDHLRSMPKVLMTRDGNGYAVLVLQMEFNRGWIEVGEALKRTRYKMADRNRSLGIYYIESGQVDEDDEPVYYQIKLNRSEQGLQIAAQYDDEKLVPIEVSDALLNAIKTKLL